MATDETKKPKTFEDKVNDPAVALHCVVCDAGSHRTDWQKKDLAAGWVACDRHSDEEIRDAVRKRDEQVQATSANDAGTAGEPASSADANTANTKTSGSGANVTTPQGTKTVIPASPTTQASPEVAASAPTAVQGVSPTAGQQVRSTQAPTAAPTPQNAGNNVPAPTLGQNPPPGQDPTKKG